MAKTVKLPGYKPVGSSKPVVKPIKIKVSK